MIIAGSTTSTSEGSTFVENHILTVASAVPRLAMFIAHSTILVTSDTQQSSCICEGGRMALDINPNLDLLGEALSMILFPSGVKRLGMDIYLPLGTPMAAYISSHGHGRFKSDS